VIRFVLRRLLQLIPTVVGVVLVTFVLFNVVGGSPARFTLGPHATAETLEAYDEVRGFNRPLLFGWWTKTRALPDMSFSGSAMGWQAVEGVQFRPPEGPLPGRIVLPAGRRYPIPLAFPLSPDAAYRLTIAYRTSEGAEVRCRVAWESAGEDADAESAPVVDLPPDNAWRTVEVDMPASPEGRARTAVIDVSAGDMECRSVRLQRKMPHPLHSQFAFYLRQLARLDFGTSSSTNQKVSAMLRAGIGPSLALTVPIFLVGIGVSVGLSLLCAYFRNRFIDRFFVVLAVALMSINYLIFIIVGQFLLSFKAGWFPVWGFESPRYLILPVAIGVISGLGGNLRFYRTVMLDEMYRDYVRTAFAKGADKRTVLLKHVLKNAMIPILTNVVIAIPFLYTGSLLLETFFGIPGLGYLAVTAIGASDLDVIRAIVLIGSLLFVAANLLTDLCYAWVDPRVTLR
jgi:peptide/nickel transport system permease protein